MLTNRRVKSKSLAAMNSYLIDYNRLRNRKKCERSAVKKLEAYINEEETKFGVINIDENKTGCQPRILKSLIDLKAALDKDKSEIEEVYEYIKKSNKAMKKITEKLKEEMKLSRVNINEEFIDFENMDTDRLLNINPKGFLTTMEKGK